MLDPREFGIADLPAFARIAVEPQPQYQQQSAKCAGVDEGLTPVEARPDHEQPDRRRGQDHADRRCAVDPADRKSAFFLRKPFARRANDGWEMPRLADAEDDTRGHERGDRSRETMGDMADRPDGDRNAVADLGAKAVDQPAHSQKTQRIGGLKRHDDVAIVILAPPHLLTEDGRQQAEHRAVDIVDRRCGEQQRDDQPAIAPRPGHRRRRSCCNGLRHMSLPWHQKNAGIRPNEPRQGWGWLEGLLAFLRSIDDLARRRVGRALGRGGRAGSSRKQQGSANQWARQCAIENEGPHHILRNSPNAFRAPLCSLHRDWSDRLQQGVCHTFARNAKRPLWIVPTAETH